ncbi:hypothetical protein D3C85_1610810 [compost metagenome]
MNVVRFQTASGIAKDRLGTIIAWYVLIQPMSVKRRSSGTTTEMPGNIDVAMMTPRISDLKRKFSREIA